MTHYSTLQKLVLLTLNHTSCGDNIKTDICIIKT
jgi:hypothetical protein